MISIVTCICVCIYTYILYVITAFCRLKGLVPQGSQGIELFGCFWIGLLLKVF